MNDQNSRNKFLSAALTVIRKKGYTAARIDDICVAAGLTKGSFFHHFKSKDDLALAAIEHWNDQAEAHFASGGFREHADPLDRILGYIDFRKSILTGEVWSYSCLLGTMIEDVYDTHSDLRAACDHGITLHAKTVERDIAQAMREYGMNGGWTPESLAFHIQAVVQGALVLAKAQDGAAVARDCLDHLRRYVELLFQGSGTSLTRSPSTLSNDREIST